MFGRKSQGQTLVEYALILVLLAVGLVLSLTSLGDEVEKALDEASSSLSAGGSPLRNLP